MGGKCEVVRWALLRWAARHTLPTSTPSIGVLLIFVADLLQTELKGAQQLGRLLLDVERLALLPAPKSLDYSLLAPCVLTDVFMGMVKELMEARPSTLKSELSRSTNQVRIPLL